MAVNISNADVFKVWNFCYFEKPLEVVIDAISVLMGDYDNNRKGAANLLLKALLKDEFKKFLFEDKELYPTDRSDARVHKWKKQILSVGMCAKCGSSNRLEAHHILHWSDYPMGRVDINNGECLCHECHTSEHEGENVYNLMKAKKVGKC